MTIGGHGKAHAAESLREQPAALRVEKRSIKAQMAQLAKELACTQAQLQAAATAAQAQEQALQELAHRTRNNLQLVVGLLELEARRIGDPATRERLREVAGRVHRLGTSHDGLHHLGASGKVDLVAYLAGLGRTLAGMLDRPGIRLHGPTGKAQIDAGRAAPIGLFVQEAVGNAIRHAFPSDRGGTITIAVEPRHGGVIAVTVADDGIGLPGLMAPDAAAPGIGMRLLACLARKAGARLEVERNDGTKYRLLVAAG
jgi:two-component sensor histidine kinase